MNQVFAPIAVLMPYRSINEAIEIANGTRYGLGASVFGPDQAQCLKIAKQLDCGMVSINDFGVFYVSFLSALFAVADGVTDQVCRLSDLPHSLLNIELQPRLTFRWFEV
jgi:hypothetical protein